MKESQIERKVVEYAERRGVMHLKLNVRFRRGWPDHLFAIPGGRPLFIEFKKPGGKLSALQALTIEKLQEIGYDAGWTESAEEAISWIEACIDSATTGKMDSAQTPRIPVARSGVSGDPRRRGPVRKPRNG